jgi:hypothetical protein
MRKPITEGRRKAVHIAMQVCSYIVCYVLLVIPEAVEVEADYSHYLGTGYEESYKRPNGRVSTYVANHVSGIDVPVIGSLLAGDCSALAGAFIRNVPIVGFVMDCNEGLYAPRGGSAEAKQKTVELIETRQR